jgi:hypothetical protein
MAARDGPVGSQGEAGPQRQLTVSGTPAAVLIRVGNQLPRQRLPLRLGTRVAADCDSGAQRAGRPRMSPRIASIRLKERDDGSGWIHADDHHGVTRQRIIS